MDQDPLLVLLQRFAPGMVGLVVVCIPVVRGMVEITQKHFTALKGSSIHWMAFVVSWLVITAACLTSGQVQFPFVRNSLNEVMGWALAVVGTWLGAIGFDQALSKQGEGD